MLFRVTIVYVLYGTIMVANHCTFNIDWLALLLKYSANKGITVCGCDICGDIYCDNSFNDEGRCV